MLNTRTLMRRSAASHRDSLAIESGSRQLTFGQAWERGLRVANALLELGLRPGDRVGILESNCLASADIILGLTAANMVRVALYKRNSAESHHHMLANCGCKAIVVDAELVDEILEVKPRLPLLEHIIVRDAGYENWLNKHPVSDPDPEISENDIYIIRNSGGTTGKPKGMAFTHRAWLNMERDWTYLLPPIARGDVAIHAAPVSHGSGYFFFPVWMGGGCNVLETKFKAERLLDLLSERGGYSFAVPTMIGDYVNSGSSNQRDFSRLKAMIISGAPIGPKTLAAARDLFGDRLYQLYGQTEVTPVAWMSPQDWFGTIEGSQPMLSAGKIMPFAQVEICAEDGTRLGAGEVGEIAMRADGQMTYIWNDPELTAKRLVDGWIMTGDIGHIDKNGFLYLSDRKDEMIISGGMNIWPLELENAIESLPNVREVAVFGVPDARWGEVPMAIVVPKEDLELREADVIQVCVKALGGYKKPGRVIIRTEPLPRSPVGKILRKALREPYWEGQDRRVAGT